MSESFALLAQFLERFGADVEGRALESTGSWVAADGAMLVALSMH